MAFTPITVTRRYLTAELAIPAAGTVRLTPTAPMVNVDTVVAAGRVGSLDAEGDLTLVVAANNDPGTTPVGVSYEVREDITGQPIRTYYVTVPYDAAGGAVDLSTLASSPVPPYTSDAAVLRRAVHNGTAYPARPAGIPAGFVDYVGPTQPTDWLDGDTWIETA